jgi:hypothetical protein
LPEIEIVAAADGFSLPSNLAVVEGQLHGDPPAGRGAEDREMLRQGKAADLLIVDAQL